MRDLTAQVTSCLLRFPEVTVNALGEDEITLDSVLHGKFTLGRSGLAWLACGPQLEAVHAVTGERFSAYRFSGLGEHPPAVLLARDFSWLKRTGLLVGLEEAEGSLLCLYDLSISRVVKAVVIPGRITGIEPLVSYGGANASTQHLHQSLRWFFGVVVVVTDVGHVLLVDLCLDDLSCSQSELEASDLEVVNKSPVDIPRLRESVTRQGRHLCLQLSSPTGTGVTALQYITRTNQLAVGYSDGYLQLWNMKTLKKEYHSQLEGGRVPVYAFTFQEPENDPRNCCYLWAVQSAQDHEGDVVSLHLLQLAFGERKCLALGKILYEGLEYCEERYSQDLNGSAFPLRAQATNTRLLGCQTIEKFRHHSDRDDSANEVASPDISVSIFSWQVKSYGQGKPSTYIGVFDINRWYHAQMPDSLRAGESLHSCPYLAVWSLDAVVEMTAPSPLLDILVHERSLSRGLPYTCPPPEQFFNPTTYNFDATCLLNSGVVHLTCSGYQKETLSFLKKSAPNLKEAVPDSYSRCLMSGLLSSRLADVQPSSLSQEEQLDAILSTAVETSSLGLITGYVRQWMSEDQPQAAGNLRYILEWAWGKVVHTKEELDTICTPLFDSSSNFTDPQTLQLLQHSQRLLGNLSTIFQCLLSEAQGLTQKGLVGLLNKKIVSSLIAQYAQVVLWFCRTGLLPEGTDDGVLQISRPFYNYSIIKNYYTGRRAELQHLSKGKWCSDCLMIDGLVAQFGERLTDLWKRDEGGTGQYPPPTLHALLDIYLSESVDETAKHAIVLYLLLDVMYSYPNKSGASVESFPTAFAIPIGLVKLVQGLWLLDHHDHENSLELLLHPSTSRSLWPWQHERILQALMCQGQHSVALRYLHTVKPHLASAGQLKLCLAVLLHNRCTVEACALLRQHSNKLNVEEMFRFLYETCQDLGLMKELLKLPLGFSEQEALEKFLRDTGGSQNKELLVVHYLQRANYVPALQLNQALKMNLVNDRNPKMKDRSSTRNSILEQYGKVLPKVQRKLATERVKPYRRPSTVFREVSRPQPLSTVAKQPTTENVLTRAAFISNVLTKIGEVWVGKDTTPETPPQKSPRVPELPFPATRPSLVDLPEAFIGTPVALAAKRRSRALDLVLYPSTRSSPEGVGPQHTPLRHPSGGLTTPSTGKTSYLQSIAQAPELSLLQTPQVVKRARSLAASGPMFSSFTPQSILRSSLRPTPVASPSASPGRSASPPLRPKECRITFIEEAPSPDLAKVSARLSSTTMQDGDIGLPSRSSALKPVLEQWGAPPLEGEEQEEQPVLSSAKEQSSGEGGKGGSVREVVAGRVSLGGETSQASIQSVDTTLEYHDAPQPEDLIVEEPLQEEAEGEDVRSSKFDIPAVSVSPSQETSEEGPAAAAKLTPGVEEQELAEDQVSFPEVLPREALKREAHQEQIPEQEVIEVQDQEPPEEPVVLESREDASLDEFVERHLFGEDQSPTLTRFGIKETSQGWTSCSSSEFRNKEEWNTSPVLAKEPSEASASHGSTTSESPSVVSLNESEELSSTSEEEVNDPVQEDSGSEVEIIGEDKGNGSHPDLLNAGVVLEQLHSSQYLEQQTVVLSVLKPEILEIEAGETEAMLMLNMKTADEDVSEPIFTELKPSTTLLIPMEPDEENLRIRGPLELGEDVESEVPHMEPLGNFTLMLEADAEERDNELAKAEVDADVMIVEHSLSFGGSEQHDVVHLGKQPGHSGGDVPVTMDVHLPTTLPDVIEQQVDDDSTKGLTDELEGSQQNAVKASEELPSISIETGVTTTIPEHVLEAEVEKPKKIQTEEPDVEGVPAHVDEKALESANDTNVTELKLAQVEKTKADIAENVQEVTSTAVASDSTQELKKLKKDQTPPVVEKTGFMNEELTAASERLTRQRKTVSFPSPLEEPENDVQSQENAIEQMDSQVPLTPRRRTRSVKHGQDSEVPLTPRRSSRLAESSQLLKEEEVSVGIDIAISDTDSSKPQTPQKATPRKGTRRTRNTNAAVDEDIKVMEEPSEKESAELPVTRARSARKAKAPNAEVPLTSLANQEVPGNQPPKTPSSPGRVMRKSRGITLALELSQVEPQEVPLVMVMTPKRSTKKTKEGHLENTNVPPIAEELPQIRSSRRSTRSQLWNHLGSLEAKKELPLLETSLEVEPGTQLAEAVMERLKDTKEGWKEMDSPAKVTEIVRSKRRVTKAVIDQVPSPPSKTLEPDDKKVVQKETEVTEVKPSEKQVLDKSRARKTGRSTRPSTIAEPDSSPVRHTFIFSPPQTRGRTKGIKADFNEQNDTPMPQFTFSPPATRARRPASSTVPGPATQGKHTEDAVPKVEVKEAEDSKPRKKRTTKVKAVAVAPLPVEINLVSPMASPAEPAAPRSKKGQVAEGVPQRMTLRRKRTLEVVFPKPVTRRKMF
uniref:AT-hook containing transcription factor 1 n=1 Tax=Paramormyrops kingsleyae TaxID=1676925 RepID=A0A3B3RZK5_9TELE|nr:protein ELYS [Paramormyrops kingsleyae]XP_023694528.1 protein ELYS [Paramormyrops kingsleyae]